jgi:uncharacterized membrane protein YGL010W
MIEILIITLTAVVATLATFYVNHELKQGPVRSSAVLTLVVALLCHIFSDSIPIYLSKNIPMVFIGGSFIGMASKTLTNSYVKLALSSLIFSVIYLNTSSFFNGYGGALGASAGIALMSVLGLPFLTPRKHCLTNGVLQLRKFIFKQKQD